MMACHAQPGHVETLKSQDQPDDGQHHGLDGGDAEVLGGVVGLVLQDVLHDEDDVLDELGVRVIHYNLSALVKELLHNDLYLIKQDRVEGRVHLMAH